MSAQLALAIQLRDNASFANYVSGDNGEVIDHLTALVHDKGSVGAVYLWGRGGSGKSHLLQAVCHACADAGLDAVYVPLAQADELAPVMLEGLEGMHCVCIDDIDRIAGDRDWEEALFHLFNRCFDRGTQLIFAAEKNVAALGLSLADLASRLSWGFVFQLHELSDAEKQAALRRRAHERGFELPDRVAEYLIRRQARDMAALFDMLDELDKASLAAQRRLTIPFVKELFKGAAHDDQGELF